MTLPVGTKLGPYEIVEPLGAGGMGEVYRSRDARLGREVAIKTLPGSFIRDEARLARFEREARLLAALNHPNICTIYGIEEAAGVRFLILELVDGETLADCLTGAGRRPLALSESLAIARQVADALDAAHERGIVHRDLKAANIKITSSGTVKVLDFGIAKEVGIHVDRDGLDPATTPTMIGTVAGVILGTAAYMSPEQARGKALDKRTDIWAFGCILYEMLTDRMPFDGDTVSDTIAKILERDVDWSQLPAATPVGVRRILRRCLEKDVNRRARDIGDVRLDIEECLAERTTTAMSAGAIATRSEVHFQRLTDFSGLKESPAISPDGKMVAFVALSRGRRQIWIRLLAGGTPLQVTRDDVDHEEPRWTPDSSTLVYYGRPGTSGQEGAIWEASALGGVPRLLSPAVGGGDVSHDGERIAVFRRAADQIELVVVRRAGSDVSPVARFPASSLYSSPRWSPDDRWIGFMRSGSSSFDASLEIMSVSDSQLLEVTRSSILKGFSWLPDGSGLVFSSSDGSTLLYPPVFNLRTIRRDGSGSRQLTFGDQSYVDPDVHQSGRVFACRVRSQSDIWRFPVAGTPEENTRSAVRITRQTGQVQAPSASPDGTAVAFISDNGGHSNLWVAKTDGSDVRQITFERDPAVAVGVPLWSPAGDWIAFVIRRQTQQTGLSVILPDGRGLRELVRGWSPAWSRDGRWLYYTPTRLGATQLERISVEGGPPVVVRHERTWSPAIAADNRTLYYVHWPNDDIFGRSGDAEIRRVVENGAPETLARVEGLRIPVLPFLIQPFLSPDDRTIALHLMDGATTNLWAMSADGGPMRKLTDFGDRAIVIARSISWSGDSRHLYAAVAETETDVVLLDGLLP